MMVCHRSLLRGSWIFCTYFYELATTPTSKQPLKLNENSDLSLQTQGHPIVPLPTSLCSSSLVIFPALAANRPEIKKFQREGKRPKKTKYQKSMHKACIYETQPITGLFMTYPLHLQHRDHETLLSFHEPNLTTWPVCGQLYLHFSGTSFVPVLFQPVQNVV